MFDLAGRTALVTGAGRHVGAGIASALAVAGARVIVNDVSSERAGAVAGRLGSGAVAAPFDVSNPAEVDAAVARLGPIDILVNNAGIPTGMQTMAFREMPRDEWRRYVDLNLYGSINCISAVVDGMCDRGWGRIVQISSAAGRIGVARGIALYGASKSGIEGFIRHLSQEVGKTGVTANSIALGMMGTEASSDPEVSERLARTVPVGRIGTPADAGAAVVYVASEEASWLTGQTIHLDGGQVTT
jgi:NAD(P)-dependent dehydrogenase (short-subunit alcohol dehydrogenase family)